MSEKHRFHEEPAPLRTRLVRMLGEVPPCPSLPDLGPIGVPAAVVCEESLQAALQAIHETQEQATAYRRFLRDGAAYRMKTGRSVPEGAWAFACDEVDRLNLQRQRIQEAVGAYRRKREEAKRASFERAFVDICRRELDVDRFAELASAAQLASRGAA